MRTIPDQATRTWQLRTRHAFVLLTAGQAVSAFGDAFSTVAMPLLMLRLTGSVAKMGLIVGVSTVSQLVGGVLAGSVVDRVDRRRLALTCDVARLLLCGLIPVAWLLAPAATWARLGAWLAYFVVAATSLLFSLYEVAFRAVLPQLVGRDRLTIANARLAMSTEVAYGIGPALAGLTIAAIGEPFAIGINALSFGIAALAWYLLRPEAAAAPDVAGHPLAWRGRLAGLRFVWADRTLRSLGAVEAANALLFAGASTLFIYYVRHDLGMGSTPIGILLTFGSVGAVAAALTATQVRSWLGPGRALLAAAALQGLTLAAVAFADSIAALAALIVVFGFSQILTVILAMSLRQERTPDQLLGRVSATILTAGLAMRGVGGVTSTSLAGSLSARTVFVLIGLVALTVFALGLLTPLARRQPAESAG